MNADKVLNFFRDKFNQLFDTDPGRIKFPERQRKLHQELEVLLREFTPDKEPVFMFRDLTRSELISGRFIYLNDTSSESYRDSGCGRVPQLSGKAGFLYCITKEGAATVEQLICCYDPATYEIDLIGKGLEVTKTYDGLPE